MYDNGTATLDRPTLSTASVQSSGTEAIRLNLGGGDVDIPGFLTIDRKRGSEVYPLPQYDACSVDEIRASHVLEHFAIGEAEKVLAEWMRVLKPGGRIRLAVPDLEKWAQMLVNGEPGNYVAWLYGGQTDPSDFHKNGWNTEGLTQVMRSAGITAIEPWQSDVQDCASLPISCNLQGVKAIPVKRSLGCFMSTPRLVMKHNYLCVIDTVLKRNVSLRDYGGAYWHHGMERLMRENWDDYEWFLTVDYDTVYKPETLDRLSIVFEQNPDIDALAALQMKRENTGLLANLDANSNDLLKEAIPAQSAHFGFTLFRAESVKRFAAWCKARGEPMMLEKCSPDFDWGEKRIDADINFWLRWKEAGFKLCITPRISVGHLEELAVWPGEDFKAIYQPMNEFQKHGAPVNARR